VRFAIAEVLKKVSKPAVVVPGKQKERELMVNPLKEEAFHALRV